MAHLTLISSGPQPADEAPLDAYSRVVTEVAERLAPSVANLRVSRRFRGRRVDGGGSGVVITSDGFMLTSAHVVERAETVVASFADGRELETEVVGPIRCPTWPYSGRARLGWTGPVSTRRSSATPGRCA